MLEDWWAHHYFDNPKAKDEIEDTDFDLQAELDALERGSDDWVEL